jgi:hypothetical protein
VLARSALRGSDTAGAKADNNESCDHPVSETFPRESVIQPS